MQATQPWYGAIERVPKREFWFALIRVIIVVALIGAAVRWVAIAYAPQPSAMSQQLNCPPDVVTVRDTVVSPQVLSVTEQSATDATSGDGLADKSERRSIKGKEQGRQSGAKKPPTTYSFARNGVSQKRAAMGEPQKRGGTDANQQKAKASAPTLAHSGIFPSTFGDMHGQ